MTYSTVAAARAAGATGTDPQVQAALDLAGQQIDTLTSQWWNSRVATVRVQVDRDGYARLPRRVQTVTAVRAVGGLSDVTPSLYLVESSAVLGGLDRLRIAGSGSGRWDVLRNHDPLYYMGHQDRQPTSLDVTGTFGVDPTPAAISEAEARIAARITGAATVVNAEGDADLGTPPQVPDLTYPTGDPQVDALLRPYIPSKVRVS